MKRKREVEKESEMRTATVELSVLAKFKPVDHDASEIPTNQFLSICNLILQFLDKVGPTMTVLRQDIYQNIQRLETMYESDPSMYSNMVEILKKEANEGNARKLTSCSRAFLWLTRSLDFTVSLLQKSKEEPKLRMEQAVEDAYNLTLKPWHGWISSAAYKIALKLVPDSETFANLLMAKDEKHETLVEEIDSFVSQLSPFLSPLFFKELVDHRSSFNDYSTYSEGMSDLHWCFSLHLQAEGTVFLILKPCSCQLGCYPVFLKTGQLETAFSTEPSKPGPFRSFPSNSAGSKKNSTPSILSFSFTLKIATP